jgi:hypothetical protein
MLTAGGHQTTATQENIMTEQGKTTDITADTTVDDTAGHYLRFGVDPNNVDVAEGHFYQAKDDAEDDAEGHRIAKT